MIPAYLIAGLVLFIPNTLRFTWDLGVQGLNTLNIVTGIVLIVCLMVPKPDGPSPRAPLTTPIALFMVMLTVGFLNSVTDGSRPFVPDAVYFKTQLFYVALYFLSYYAIRDDRSVRVVSWTLLGVVGLVALQVVRQHMSLAVVHYSLRARVSGPFGVGYGAANYAGIFFAQFVPVLVAALLYERRATRRGCLAIVTALGTLALFYTYSRKSYYALAVAIAVVAVLRSRRMLVVVAALILMFPAWAPDTAVERLEMTVELNEYGEEVFDESTQMRFLLWEGARTMIEQYPFGVGLDRFKAYIGRYSSFSGMDVHNYYLLVAAECGVLGLLALLFLLARLYQEGIQLLRIAGDDSGKALAVGFLGCLAALTVVNTFGSAMENGELMGDFWILAGLISRARVLRAVARGAGAGRAAHVVGASPAR